MTAMVLRVLILLALFTVLVVQNADVVRIQFLFWGFDVSLVIVLLATAILGAGVGLLMAVGLRRRRAGKRAEGRADPTEVFGPTSSRSE